MSKKDVLNKALVAARGVESDVAIPSRVRSGSFASMLAGLDVGEEPIAKTMLVAGELSINEALEGMAAVKERLRNNVTSSISAAKRRLTDASYSIEITHFIAPSGLYVVALVSRVA